MGTSQGALRGMGKQFELMSYNLIGFWMVGFATGYTLTFVVGVGLPGLWLGILLGVNTVAALNINKLLSVDWQQEAKTVQGEQAADTASLLHDTSLCSSDWQAVAAARGSPSFRGMLSAHTGASDKHLVSDPAQSLDQAKL